MTEFEKEKAELESVLGSAAFVRSARMTALLAYLCEKYFSGETDTVKEYSIAVQVLGRQESFDPSHDAIARVEVHRLRRKLSDFYAGEGASHSIQIQIPPGSYVPRFVPAVPLETAAPREINEAQFEETPAPEELLQEPPRESTFRMAVAPAWIRKRGLVSSLSAFVILVAAFSIWWRSKGIAVVLPAEAGVSRTVAATPPLPPLESGELRILCGHPKPHTGRSGMLWNADRFFAGGFTSERSRQFLANTNDFTIFEHFRFGNFSYDIPLHAGVYELHLYFAETAYGPSTVSGGGESSRLFDVEANGERILRSFDIAGDAPGSFVADERVFKDISPGADGKLHLRFISSKENAIVSAIALYPATPHRIRPVRFSAQDQSYTDSQGQVWEPDNYWSGGQKPFHQSPVHGTPDPGLYVAERYGHFSYSIPVAPGAYEVALHLAETYWGPSNPGGGGAGSRVFDVYCNGVALIRNLDLIKKAGENTALVLRFPGSRPSAQGKLLLSFVPIENYALINAIEVINTGE